MGSDIVKDFYEKGINRERFEGNLDYLELADLIYVLLETAWGEDWGIFTMENPKAQNPKNINFPRITFQLKEQKPGIVGNNKTRERKPRVRGQYKKTKKETGETFYVDEYGQRFDALIQFSVFAESNLEAIRLSEDFMNFIFKYEGILQKHGVQNIWFDSEKEGEDAPSDSIYTREINYIVVFEKIYPTIKNEIKEINVKVSMAMDCLREKGLLPSQNAKNKEDYK